MTSFVTFHIYLKPLGKPPAMNNLFCDFTHLIEASSEASSLKYGLPCRLNSFFWSHWWSLSKQKKRKKKMPPLPRFEPTICGLLSRHVTPIPRSLAWETSKPLAICLNWTVVEASLEAKLDILKSLRKPPALGDFSYFSEASSEASTSRGTVRLRKWLLTFFWSL